MLLSSNEAKFNLKIEEILRKNSIMEDFVSKTQPDDETRHRLALLKMPTGRTYTENDLEDEFTMKVGLHLLYNKIQGKKVLYSA